MKLPNSLILHQVPKATNHLQVEWSARNRELDELVPDPLTNPAMVPTARAAPNMLLPLGSVFSVEIPIRHLGFVLHKETSGRREQHLSCQFLKPWNEKLIERTSQVQSIDTEGCFRESELEGN